MQQQPGLLQSAFAETDTVSYGPFRVSKAPGATWKEAQAFVDQQEVMLRPFEKRYLALLITQQGQPLYPALVAPEMTSFTGQNYLRAMAGSDYAAQRLARREIANATKVTVSNIKRRMKACDVPEETRQMIVPFNPIRRKGEAGPFKQGLAGSFRIQLFVPV